MAKKKSKSNLGKVLGIVAAILGLVAICMIFIDTIKVPDTKLLGKVVEGEGYTGLEVVFGFKTDDVAVFDFSIMALLPYVLIIAGIVFSVVNAKSKKGNKILDFVTTGLFLVAAVLCFLMPSFVVCADTILGKIADAIEYDVTTGAVVAAGASLVAAVVTGVKAVK